MTLKKKSDIVGAVLNSGIYNAAEISDLVSKAVTVGYSKVPDIGPWQLYTQGQQFFAAGRKAGEKRYVIIQGEAPAKAVQLDLEQIAGEMLAKRNLFYMTFVRTTEVGGTGGTVAGITGLILGGSVSLPIVLTNPTLNNSYGSLLVVGVAALASVTSMIAAGTIRKVNNNKITQGLSEHALNYEYGWDAEREIEELYGDRLQREKRGQLYDCIKSGEIGKEDIVDDPNIVITDST